MFSEIGLEPGTTCTDSYRQPKIILAIIFKDCNNRKICEVSRINFYNPCEAEFIKILAHLQ